MTKKDYELIAKNLGLIVKVAREVENSNDSDSLKLAIIDKTISQMIYFFIKDLEKENPRFDREKFLKAVNYR